MSSRLTGISSMAMRQTLADLSGAYEQRTGRRIVFQSMGGVDAARRIRAGNPADVVVLASKVMEELETEGHIIAGTRADLARSGIAMAVRSGAPRPSLGNEEAVRKATLDARRICYSTGPSGDHLKQLWQRWGILDAISDRVVQVPPGVPVASVLAKGEADLGFQQLSELLHRPGVNVVGPLPAEIQAVTVFSAGVSTASLQGHEAQALIAYLISSEADEAKRRYGLEPA
jgi:molybdate transport system substrate-binding protein